MPGDLSADLKNPYLFSEYQAGEYEYSENDYGGRVAFGSLALTDTPMRDNAAQANAGGEMRRANDSEWGADDGGHLVGARFGGSPGEENLTAQSRNLNRGAYKRMENQWAAHLEAGDKVFVYIETDQPYRPEAYMGYVIYETPEGTRDYDTFHMINESQSEIARWEAEAEAEWYLGDTSAMEADSYLGSAAGETNEYLGSAAETAMDYGGEETGMSM